jgi:hypothetical protein
VPIRSHAARSSPSPSLSLLYPVRPAPRAQRDLTATHALGDGCGGALGIERLEIATRVEATVNALLVARIRDALANGALELDLADAEAPALPAELRDLPWLSVIDASGNRLSMDALSALAASAHPALRALTLSRNLLAGPLPAEGVAGLAAEMEELDFAQNYITGALPEALARFTRLE